MAFKFTDVVFKIGIFSEDVGDRDVPFVYGKKKKTVKTVTFTYIDKAVLNALATRANENDGTCRPGYGCIAEDTLLSRRACMDSVKKLEWFGFISIASGDASKYLSNTYTLNMDKLCEAAGLTEEETKKKKARRFKGKDGEWHYAYENTKEEPKVVLCDTCGKPLLECVCEYEFLDSPLAGPAEPEKQDKQNEKQMKFTCPVCGLNGYGTQAILHAHIRNTHPEHKPDQAPVTSFMLEGDDPDLDESPTTSFNLEGDDPDLF